MLSIIATCAALGVFAEQAFVLVQSGTPVQEMISQFPPDGTDGPKIAVEIILAAESFYSSPRTIYSDAQIFGEEITRLCIASYDQGVAM